MAMGIARWLTDAPFHTHTHTRVYKHTNMSHRHLHPLTMAAAPCNCNCACERERRARCVGERERRRIPSGFLAMTNRQLSPLSFVISAPRNSPSREAVVIAVDLAALIKTKKRRCYTISQCQTTLSRA